MRGVLATAGALAIITGLALAGFVGWQVWGTDITAAHAQRDASGVLDVRWRDAATAPASEASTGEPIARLTIPRLGADWSRVLLEGVDDTTLDRGPGRYPGTAQPGQTGNFAIAGHRVSHGAPFYDADALQVCDPIEVSTATTIFTYRVLPQAGSSAPCDLPLVQGVPGREIVTPEDIDVIAPRGEARLLTITTCHPRYSARERLIIHAVLVESQERS